eukprot:1635704-Amphidinium_carterae.1
MKTDDGNIRNAACFWQHRYGQPGLLSPTNKLRFELYSPHARPWNRTASPKPSVSQDLMFAAPITMHCMGTSLALRCVDKAGTSLACRHGKLEIA